MNMEFVQKGSILDLAHWHKYITQARCMAWCLVCVCFHRRLLLLGSVLPGLAITTVATVLLPLPSSSWYLLFYSVIIVGFMFDM